MDPRLKRFLIGVGAAAAAMVSLFTVLDYWEKYGLWRPATISEVRAEVSAVEVKMGVVESKLATQLAMTEQQTVETKSLLLNDLLLRTQKAIYENLREQDRYKATGQDVPRWLIDEWLRLENDQTRFQSELEGLQPEQ